MQGVKVYNPYTKERLCLTSRTVKSTQDQETGSKTARGSILTKLKEKATRSKSSLANLSKSRKYSSEDHSTSKDRLKQKKSNTSHSSATKNIFFSSLNNLASRLRSTSVPRAFSVASQGTSTLLSSPRINMTEIKRKMGVLMGVETLKAPVSSKKGFLEKARLEANIRSNRRAHGEEGLYLAIQKKKEARSGSKARPENEKGKSQARGGGGAEQTYYMKSLQYYLGTKNKSVFAKMYKDHFLQTVASFRYIEKLIPPTADTLAKIKVHCAKLLASDFQSKLELA